MSMNQPQTSATKTHNCHDADDGFKHLQAHVSPKAFDRNQEGEAPACHPNTRTAVLDELMDCILQRGDHTQRMIWLNGAAGAGKSAIARSIVQRCQQNNVCILRFFFFRADATRNTIEPVVATLAHQLIQVFPHLKAQIVTEIFSNPLMFKMSVEEQFSSIIFKHLLELKENSHFFPSLVFLFDGLDECEGDTNQSDLIDIFSGFVRTHNDLPVIVFFGSRPEHQITMAFNNRQLAPLLLRVPLDNRYLPDADIRLFLDDSFGKLRQTHPLADRLPENWPVPAHIQEIVDKSSGQFIYASVVIKFISFPSANPATRLEIIRGLRPAGRLTPFAQLDALYRHILSQVQDLQRTMPVLAAITLCPDFITHGVHQLAPFLHETQEDVKDSLIDLTSVISYTDDSIQFLHASLPDFLMDPLRSGDYCVSTPEWPVYLSLLWFNERNDWLFWSLLPFLRYAQPCPELREAVLSYKLETRGAIKEDAMVIDYLNILNSMDFGDGQGGSVYTYVLVRVTRYVKRAQPQLLLYLAKVHSVDKILNLIELEEDIKIKQDPYLSQASPKSSSKMASAPIRKSRSAPRSNKGTRRRASVQQAPAVPSTDISTASEATELQQPQRACKRRRESVTNTVDICTKCSQVADGDVGTIQCKTPACPTGRYHLSCVGLRRVRKNWTCDTCKLVSGEREANDAPKRTRRRR